MQEFVAMGGYAFYVWSSFALSVFGVVYLYVSAKSSFKKKYKEVSVWQIRHKKQKGHLDESSS